MSLNVFSSLTKAQATQVNDNFTKVLGAMVVGEDYTALTNGIKITFDTSHRFKPNSIAIFKAGVRLRKGALADYVEVYDTDGYGIQFTLVAAPLTGTALLSDYQKADADL
jgi:hypothetical protein